MNYSRAFMRKHYASGYLISNDGLMVKETIMTNIHKSSRHKSFTNILIRQKIDISC